MRAVRLDKTGPPENLTLVEVDEPVPPADGVLIRTAYAGMLYADAEARRGTYYKETRLPWWPGREVAGEVEAVGSAVSGIRAGDRVAALVFGGGCYAEKVVARTGPHSDIVKLPDNTGFGESLTYLINFRLAHLLVHAWAKVPRGSRIAVHGASGGIGSMVMDLTADLDCDIIAFVRSEAEAVYSRNLGAAHCVNTLETDYVAAVHHITGGEGVGFSFNGVGGPTIARDAEILAPFGELHLYGYVAGKQAFDPFSTDRSIALKTFNADDFLATPHFQAASDAMLARFERGGLLTPGRIFALADAAEAHRAMEAGEICGKILLRP